MSVAAAAEVDSGPIGISTEMAVAAVVGPATLAEVALPVQRTRTSVPLAQY